MTIAWARAFIAFAVIALHVIFVSVLAILLRFRITEFNTYISSIAVFLPIFGVYVAVVVEGISPERSPRKRRVSIAFFSIVLTLLMGYVLGCSLIAAGFVTGFIAHEELLPGSFALVEAAFGTALMVCLRKLYAPERVSS